jgi:D-alanyl-D-alanine carboxypeptidase
VDAPPDAATTLAYADPGAGIAEEPTDSRYAAIVIDAKSGSVLHEASADSPRHPASMTKMMTLYILFGEIESGRISLNSDLLVSAEAASQPPTKIGLSPGSSIRVEDAIEAIAVHSANDVAVAVAENISGSEPAFAARMTRTAQGLGMHSTIFRNASGLPDPGQITTARDMATLGRALQQRYPRYYAYFSTRTFTWRGRTYENTNQLLDDVPGVDGIKTGYIRASGYNLTASVQRNGRRLIVVLFGGATSKARNAQVAALIDEYMPQRAFAGWF